MTLVLADMRAGLRKKCGDIDSSDMSDPAVDLLLNKSYWEILDKFPFREKQVSSTFSFTEGVRIYTAPNPFEAVQKISISDPSISSSQIHTPLDRMTIDHYEQIYDPVEDQEDTPTNYIRYGSSFYVWPTPDKTYDGVIYYWTVLSDLSNSNNTPEMPQVWHEIIEIGGVARGWLDLNDLNKATFYFNLQSKMISSTSPVEAKEEEDSPRAGIELPDELTTI